MEENEKKYPISKHIFMFPFIIKNIEQCVEKINKDEEWIKFNFSLKSDMDYNEYHYFYPFVQKLLFSDAEQNNQLITKYHRKFQTGKFCFEVKNKEKKGNDKYELIIPEKGIELLILEEFSIGILTFHLENYDKKGIDDILIINDFARRIYPQYLPIIASKGSFVPDNITINLDGEEFAKEDFNKYQDTSNFQKVSYASYISKLLHGIEIEHILDDRMFVVSYVINDTACKDLQDFLPKYLSKSKESIICESEIAMKPINEWYQYCFVDGKDLTCQSKILKFDLLRKCTYDRWINGGTIWGISRYSLVALFNSKVPDYLLEHVNRHYCDMAQILLIIRAILIKFASDSSEIAKKLNITGQTSEIKELRVKYIKFINDVWFTEITPQEQGIEMYKIGLEQMELEKQKNDLRKDIEELFEYVEAENKKSETRVMNRLYYLGALFLPATLMAGLLGMNISYFLKPALSNNKALFLLLIPTIFLMSLTTLLIIKKSKRWKWWKWFIPLIFIIVLLLLKFTPTFDFITSKITDIFNFFNI